MIGFVTGANRGLGYELVKEGLQRGHTMLASTSLLFWLTEAKAIVYLSILNCLKQKTKKQIIYVSQLLLILKQ